MNPLDHASRGLTPDKMAQQSDWRDEPAFLCRPESKWPSSRVGELPADNLEVKTDIRVFLQVTSLNEHPLEKFSRYGSWSRL